MSKITVEVSKETIARLNLVLKYARNSMSDKNPNALRSIETLAYDLSNEFKKANSQDKNKESHDGT